MAPSAIAYTLPTMQLVCNLVMLETPSLNNTITGPSSNQSTPQIPTAPIPDGYVAYPDIGIAYRVFNASVTWKGAREECLAKGARLAVTDTYIKLEYLLKQAPTVNAIHVGIHLMYDDTEWVSATTGSTILTPPWAPGYPNGAVDCVLAGYSPRGVRNAACSTKSNYACELPVTN